MSFKQKLTLLLAAFAFMSSTVLAAGAPPNVKHVEAAQAENGTISVRWDAVTDPAGVDFYRVYFSHESILAHEGNYDDFERTTGNESTYIFSTPPLSSQKIYISVLAVNKAGIESEGFEVETSVEIAAPIKSSATSQASQSSAVSGASTTALPMGIVSTEAVSATGVLLTFTKPILQSLMVTPDMFVVIDGSGTLLAITKIEVSNSQILIHTEPQMQGKVYVLGILQPITASDGTNLPTSGMQPSFVGFGGNDQRPNIVMSSSAVSAVSSVSSIEQPMPPTYIRNPMLPSVDQPIPVINTAPVITTPTTKKTDLPDSGIGLTGILVASGLLAGRKMRKQRI